MGVAKGSKKRKQQIWIENHICHIELQDGSIALCDEDRYYDVIGKSWRWIPKRNSVKSKIFLSKTLYPEKRVWTINGNRRDMRSCNLSFVKKISYIGEDGLCHIPLNLGKESICDADDFKFVSQYDWCEDGRGYVFSLSTGKKIALHKILMPNCKYVDHIDGNRLNNCKSNLRECTNQQNSFNTGRRKHKNPLIKHKGVYLSKCKNKFTASISISGKSYHLGSFNTQEEAAKAYDDKAKELHGEFMFKGETNES